MPSVNIPIVGPSNNQRDGQISSQVCRNFYIHVDGESSEDRALVQFPGALNLSSGTGADRGAGVYKGVLYVISGNTLFSVDSAGVKTSIGTIAGTSQCVMTEDGLNLVIACQDGKPYKYDGSTLTQATDIDVPSAATVTYINRRVVYDGNNRDVVFADLDSPLIANSLNIASVDAAPDDTLAVCVFNQQLYIFGERSINPYYPTGTGNPPYAPVQNATNTTLGIKSINSVSASKNYIYFHGSDGNIHRMRGAQPQVISPQAVAQEISTYSNQSEGIGSVFSIDGQDFYYLTFPNGGSWLYNDGRGWTQLAHGVDVDPSIISRIIEVYGAIYATDRRNGNIYKLDFSTWTNNGETIYRERSTPKITPRALGAPGKRIFINRLTLACQLGVGIMNDQGSNPQIMMDWRNNGKGPWTSERWKSLGALGDGEVEVFWDELGEFDASGREFRFRISDPIGVNLYSLAIDFDVGDF